MKTLLLALLFSLSSLSFAVDLKDYYPLDAPGNTALFVAIATGDFEKAETLLKAGVNPNAKSVEGATAIHALAIADDEEGSIEFLPTLINYKADINAQDDDGYTGLMATVMARKYQLAQAFTQNEETNINTENKEGHLIIHYALVPYLSINFLKMLLLHPKIDVNKKGTSGIPPILVPLMLLANGLYIILHPEVGSVVPDYKEVEQAGQAVQVLLDSSHDVDLTLKNKKGVSPYDALEVLKENLPNLPKDSDLYPAFEPIRDILSSGKYIIYTQ